MRGFKGVVAGTLTKPGAERKVLADRESPNRIPPHNLCRGGSDHTSTECGPRADRPAFQNPVEQGRKSVQDCQRDRVASIDQTTRKLADHPATGPGTRNSERHLIVTDPSTDSAAARSSRCRRTLPSRFRRSCPVADEEDRAIVELDGMERNLAAGIDRTDRLRRLRSSRTRSREPFMEVAGGSRPGRPAACPSRRSQPRRLRPTGPDSRIRLNRPA